MVEINLQDIKKDLEKSIDSARFNLTERQAKLFDIRLYRNDLAYREKYKLVDFKGFNNYVHLFNKDRTLKSFFGFCDFVIGKTKINIIYPEHKTKLIIAKVWFIYADGKIIPIKDKLEILVGYELKKSKLYNFDYATIDFDFYNFTDYVKRLKYAHGSLVDEIFDKFKKFRLMIQDEALKHPSIIFTDREYNALQENDFDNCITYGTYIPKIIFKQFRIALGFDDETPDGRMAIYFSCDGKTYMIPLYFNPINFDNFEENKKYHISKIPYGRIFIKKSKLEDKYQFPESNEYPKTTDGKQMNYELSGHFSSYVIYLFIQKYYIKDSIFDVNHYKDIITDFYEKNKDNKDAFCELLDKNFNNI